MGYSEVLKLLSGYYLEELYKKLFITSQHLYLLSMLYTRIEEAVNIKLLKDLLDFLISRINPDVFMFNYL